MHACMHACIKAKIWLGRWMIGTVWFDATRVVHATGLTGTLLVTVVARALAPTHHTTRMQRL